MANLEDRIFYGAMVVTGIIGVLIGFQFAGVGGALLGAVVGAFLGLIIGQMLTVLVAVLYGFGVPILIIIGFITLMVLLWGVGK